MVPVPLKCGKLPQNIHKYTDIFWSVAFFNEKHSSLSVATATTNSFTSLPKCNPLSADLLAMFWVILLGKIGYNIITVQNGSDVYAVILQTVIIPPKLSIAQE